MSKRVAVRNNGDSVEKYLSTLAKPLVKPLAGLLGLQTVAAGKQAAKTAAKESFTDKVKDSAAQHAGKALVNAPKDAARAAQEKIADQNKQSQQNMQQQGQQMAEKAKQGSQITTGEPMDVSWRMLKAWSFMPGFDLFDKKLIIEHARKNKKHVGRPNNNHHHEQFNHRYKQGQAMPKGFDYDADGLEPGDLAEALLDLQLQYNPNLLQDARTKGKVGGKDDNGRPLEDNFPGITFPLLQTDEPISSTLERDKGSRATEYHPVFSAGHTHDEPSEHSLLRLTSAMHSATGAKNRPHMPITHDPQMDSMSSSVHPIAPEETRSAFFSGDDISPNANSKISQIARNRRIIAEEAKLRHEGEYFMQPVNVKRMREQGLGRSMTDKQAIHQVLGASPYADPHLNPLIYNPRNILQEQYKQYLAQQKSKEKMPEIDTPAPMHIGGGMYVWQGEYYGGLGQPSLPPEAAAMIQTGEPMDMAWRMLKSQLPFR